MPNRDSVVNTVRATVLRRSPRFVRQKTSSQKEDRTPLRRSPRFSCQKKSSPEPKTPKSSNFKSRKNPVSSQNLDSQCLRRTSRISNQCNAAGYGYKDNREKIGKKSLGSDNGSGSQANLSRESAKCSKQHCSGIVGGFQSLRRSPRFSEKENNVGYEYKVCPEEIGKKSDDGSRSCPNLSCGSKKSLTSSNGVDRFRSLRLSKKENSVDDTKKKTNKAKSCRSTESPRQSNSDDGFRSLRRSTRSSKKENYVEMTKVNSTKGISNNSENKVELADSDEARVDVESCERFVPKCEKATGSFVGAKEICTRGEEKNAMELDDGCREIGVSRKRKRDEQGDGDVHGWTKQQELALQYAYLATKPTPHFWKKISKMVPGKSAQDCFNKIHSSYMTPPQPRSLSRAKTRTNTSPVREFKLSASKLLKPTVLKVERPNHSKRKSHLAQKNVRQLLQKNFYTDQESEVDLFSVLEPNISTQDLQPSAILSTPKNLQEKKQLFHKCNGTSSSRHKKRLSRFSNSCGTDLVSPPVLKQVKNRVLHEKYIDQLHIREAKRKASSRQSRKSTSSRDGKACLVDYVDAIRAAKSALVSDAREAIDKLQSIQAMGMSSSSDLDDEVFHSNDEDDDADY